MKISDPHLLQTPVVLLLFNRPDCTRQVFRRIREAKPPHLLVVADGPRANRTGEAELCRAARAVIGEVDWPCRVERNFSDDNLGCGRRVSSGLNWVFSLVEEAIILEDDCLPDPSFFAYCQELLARYRAYEQVMSISGCNFLPEREKDAASYRFSRVPHVWGWASWRRAWKRYDFDMNGWSEFRRTGGMKRLFGRYPEMHRKWSNWLSDVHQSRIDTWDFQWCFASFAHDGLHVLPRRNLVTNIGFSASATHTLDPAACLANLPAYSADDPLSHPGAIELDAIADYETFKITNPRRSHLHKRVWRKFLTLAKQTIRRVGAGTRSDEK